MTAAAWKAWAKPTIEVTAAVLGVAVAGPLGGALGGFLGGSVSEIAKKYASKAGESAADKMLDLSTDALLEKLKDPAPRLEGLYQRTLRISLNVLQSQITVEDSASWFANWEKCLSSPQPPVLDKVLPEQLDHLDLLFQQTMQQLDAEGQAIEEGNTSLNLHTRNLPPALLKELNDKLPDLLNKNFQSLIITPDYDQAWKEQANQVWSRMLSKQDELLSKVDILLQATQEGAEYKKKFEAAQAELGRRDAVILQLNARNAGEKTQMLISLVSVSQFAAAIHIQTEQVIKRRQEVAAQPPASAPADLAGDLFELGMIYELQRDWPNALASYKEAWDLDENFDRGFKYAYTLQQQNSFGPAADIYEQISNLQASDEDRAAMLVNMGIVYAALNRQDDAEKRYEWAIKLYKKLAASDPGKYTAKMSEAFNDQANLLSDRGSFGQAEASYKEALQMFLDLSKANPPAFLPYTAGVRTNLGILYARSGRILDADTAYQIALQDYDAQRQAGGNVDMGRVAMLLLNYANLLRDTSRETDAEKDYAQSVSVFVGLANTNPAVYLPYLVRSLFQQAVLFQRTQRWQRAEQNYNDAIGFLLRLGEQDPDSVAPQIAAALYSLGSLKAAQRLWNDAVEPLTTSIGLRRTLNQTKSGRYTRDLAAALLLRAEVYGALNSTHAIEDALEAHQVLDLAFRADPGSYADLMAKILCLRAQLASRAVPPQPDACALAKQALEIAVQPETRTRAQALVTKLGPE
jgi:tetratricopeptide (TPR) repeat protein